MTEREVIILRKLKEAGYKRHQAYAVLSHLKEESRFNHKAVGDSGKAYGIAQWHPDRQRRFKSFSGVDIRKSSFDQQVDFLIHELNTDEKSAGSKLKASKNMNEAMHAFAGYERFSGWQDKNSSLYQRRMQNAGYYAKRNGINLNNPFDKDRNQHWNSFQRQMSDAAKLTGDARIAKENQIIKKYTDMGMIQKDGKGAFNDLVRAFNYNNQTKGLNDANAAFHVANNLERIFGDAYDSESKTNLYKRSNGRQILDPNFKLKISKLPKKDQDALKRVLNKKDISEVSAVELLKKVETTANKFLPSQQKLELLKNGNIRGKDLAFESRLGNNPLKTKGDLVYIPDFKKGNKGIGGGLITSTYDKRKFKYDPKNDFSYRKLEEYSPAENYTEDPYEDAPDDTSSDSSSVVSGGGTGDPYTESDTGESSGGGENVSGPEVNVAQGYTSPATAAAATEMAPEETAGDRWQKQLSGLSDRPEMNVYDKSQFKNDIPIAELAASAAALISGQKLADTDIPMRDEMVSEGYMNYAAELKKLSEIGLRPEEEAYAKRMLTESYSAGLEQLKNASNGNRNLVLGNLGRLDYQKQEGLLKIALEDSRAKNEALHKYGEAMKYISEFDANRDIANNERKFQQAMLNKQAGGQMVAGAMKSFMDTMNTYNDNKPGSAAHAYKSHLMESMWGYNPLKKDDGSGTVKGTLSYAKKEYETRLAQYEGSAKLSEQMNALPKEQRDKMGKIFDQYGYNDQSKSFLSYVHDNKVGDNFNFDDYSKYQASQDWSKMNPAMEAQKEVQTIADAENSKFAALKPDSSLFESIFAKEKKPWEAGGESAAYNGKIELAPGLEEKKEKENDPFKFQSFLDDGLSFLNAGKKTFNL